MFLYPKIIKIYLPVIYQTANILQLCVCIWYFNNDYFCLGCGNEFKSILISLDNSLSKKNIVLFPCKPPVRALSYIKCLLKHQFSSVAQSCPTLCDPMNRSTPGLPVHHQLPEFTQTHIHQVGDAIQPPHSLSSPSPPALNLSQHQGLFQWVSSSHEVARVLEFQL